MIRFKPLYRSLAAAAAIALAPFPAAADPLTDTIADAARGWLESLGPKAEQARFAFDDSERFDWHYTPRGREGVPFGDMTDAQRAAAKTLMRSALSSPGILKAEAIMALEAVLAELETFSFTSRDPEKYFITVFGTPGAAPWGWRLEGHHLSINVTVAAVGAVSVTPTFTGTNPARISEGPRAGQRVQHDEFILAIRLARTLTTDQMAAARIGDTSLGNIVSGPGRGDALKTTQGILASDLSEPQRRLLLDLIATYVGIARDEIGWPYMRLVEQGLAETHFAWAGPVSESEAFYYRIHGPRILIEFDNTQNDANHIHSLWRDPANDFGRDDLLRHYKSAHDHRP